MHQLKNPAHPSREGAGHSALNFIENNRSCAVRENLA
jgi:hypothetical protein